MWNVVGEDASIVIVGNFNPKIFHPEWFIRKELMQEWDYSGDKGLVSLPEITKFSLPGEILLQVTLDQFVLKTTRASSYATLKDLAVSIFSLLRETPVKQFGMNINRLAQLKDKKEWVSFGELLAPKGIWQTAAGDFDTEDASKLEALGLMDLTYQLPRRDAHKGWIRARVYALRASDYTIGFQVNSHVELESFGAELLVRVINEAWEDTLNEGDTIYKHLESSSESGAA
jgi:hypothetical protein